MSDLILYPLIIIGFVLLIPPAVILLGFAYSVIDWYVGLWSRWLD